ncbi:MULTISPECIES: hypothetical protein [unclassified Synechocystis]|uniref:hypothetical protein n=1 Tax=unclassified Synechocystis TaxID=2640012 RepID=UPI0004D1033A|nr:MULTISPECIES: hypothetical protein [unclassified Synechocystis]AIE73028.1 hypothetical protein D082_04990 [Synechocystis sp. PCC 6714]MCT0253546.1 hypothetical protein [Synechocystis sp. CS-94]
MNLNVFTVLETDRAARELGLDLPYAACIDIAEEIVRSKFPVCVREHLQNWEETK